MKSKTTVGGMAAARGEGPRQVAASSARTGAPAAVTATALRVVRDGGSPGESQTEPSRAESAWSLAAGSLGAMAGVVVEPRCGVILWDEVEQGAEWLASPSGGRSRPPS